MSQFCYVVINNAGHSWPAHSAAEAETASNGTASVLPQLLQEGWVPVRETPMGGGTSQLAHSLVLLMKEPTKAPRAKAAKR
jgi:hypothetical protein